MKTTKTLTRRDAVKGMAAAALGAPLLAGTRVLAADRAAADGPTDGRRKLRLGLATYSLRDLPVAEVIEIMKVLRLKNAGPFKTHIPWAGATDECRKIADLFHAAGITLTGSGVFYLQNDESTMRTAFENARAAGLVAMVCSAKPEALPLLNKFVIEYDQRVAIHNHGPEDPVYPSPADIWRVIQPFDERIGICLDIAHTHRTGDDPIDMIRLCAPRLYDFHLRDSIAPVGAKKDIPVEVGAGVLDIVGILRTLIEIDYGGVVALEYGKPENVRAGVAESIGFARGALATLGAG